MLSLRNCKKSWLVFNQDVVLVKVVDIGRANQVNFRAGRKLKLIERLTHAKFTHGEIEKKKPVSYL